MSLIKKQHKCREMPLYPKGFKVVTIALSPHISMDGKTFFGDVSWKLFNATQVPIFGLRPDHIGKELDPPICPFCGISLTEEEEKK